MGWDIRGKLASVGHAVSKVAHGAAVTGAKGLEHVVESAPIMDTFTAPADRIDDALQHFTAPHSPEAVDVMRPKQTVTLKPGTPSPISTVKGTVLNGDQQTTSFGLRMSASGEARLDLEAAAPGTDWGKQGAESATMSVYVDGKYQQDVVLWGGAKRNAYSLALGKLSAGEHTVTLRYAQEKSRPGAKSIVLSGATATAPTYASKEEKWAAENAPYIIGRHGGLQNTYTDLPLALAHRVEKQPDGSTVISYTGVFSNEDAGDGAQPSVEQARWGRLTDLETMFRVTLDPSGKVVNRSVEGIGHHWRDFEGQLDGTHPIIRTVSDNNNMTDQGGGVLRFQLPTGPAVSNDAPIEDVMREDPRFYEVETKELQREGKIGPETTAPAVTTAGKAKAMLAQLVGNPHQMADPRDYVYVQFESRGAEAAPITAKVVLKDGRTAVSDDGVKAVAIARDGWAQTAVQLPPGATAKDVARIEYVSAGGQVVAQGHAYTLTRDFKTQDLPEDVWQRGAR